MDRTESDAIKWVTGAVRQYGRLCESYDAWRTHHSVSTRDGDRTWTLSARQESHALTDEWTVDAHFFLVAAHQLVDTLGQLGRDDLLDLLPADHITHARNAIEHDDDRGWYRRDYEGFRWTIGDERTGPSNLYGLDIAPVIAGLLEVQRRLPPTAVDR